MSLRADQLLTADDLAERWRVPKAHVYRLAREGLVPTVRLGRYMRFRVDLIEAWERAGDREHDPACSDPNCSYRADVAMGYYVLSDAQREFQERAHG